MTSLPQLISKTLVAHSSYWPHTFFTPRVFLFSISLLFENVSLLCGSIIADATLKLSFEKLKPAILLTSLHNDTSIQIVYLKTYANHLPGVQVMATFSLQCNNLSR